MNKNISRVDPHGVDFDRSMIEVKWSEDGSVRVTYFTRFNGNVPINPFCTDGEHDYPVFHEDGSPDGKRRFKVSGDRVFLDDVELFVPPIHKVFLGKKTARVEGFDSWRLTQGRQFIPAFQTGEFPVLSSFDYWYILSPVDGVKMYSNGDRIR